MMWQAPEFPVWLMASAWGGLVSLGLLLGALAGVYAPLKHRGITSAMAAGAEILVAAASLDLIVAAVQDPGRLRAGLGLVVGAAAFSLANLWLARHAAKHRKRCGACVSAADGERFARQRPGHSDGHADGCTAGISRAWIGNDADRHSRRGTARGFRVGNLAEALSSASGMKDAGRSKKYIFGLWSMAAFMVTLLAGLTAGLSVSVPQGLGSVCNAFAAGALIAMVVETMIPRPPTNPRRSTASSRYSVSWPSSSCWGHDPCAAGWPSDPLVQRLLLSENGRLLVWYDRS